MPLSPSKELVRGGLFRGLDIFTVKWASGDLPEECRFLPNRQFMFLKKEEDPTSKQFDDDEWIRSLTEAQEVTTDVPEDRVMYDQQEVDSQKVRPIPMGEFLQRYVSRRGRNCDEWMTGSLSGLLARIKVDEKNCSEMIVWKAVREAASRFLPKHTAAAVWKHRNVSFVEQEGLSPLPKDRGAEQGDVDGLPGVQPGSGHGGSGGARKHCRTASGGHPSLDCRQLSGRGAASTSRIRSKSTRVSQLSAWWPGSAHWCPRRPRETCRKSAASCSTRR